MIIKISVNIPDMECIYCYSLDTEIVTYMTTKENLIEISYGCKKCQRNWTDVYDIVYTLTKTDEVLADEKDCDKN